MNKKISILTFHSVPNYGAVLQAYGMQQYLKKYADNVEIIDYKPDYLFKEYKYINTYSLKSVVFSLYSLFYYVIKKCNFYKFIKANLCLSLKTYKTKEELQGHGTEVLILGSDQIWNPQITYGFDPAFFGNLEWIKQPLIMSYAASLGKGMFSEGEKEELGKLLEKIEKISVREEEAFGVLRELTEKEIEVVADPTVLVGKECFDKLTKTVKQKKYLLFYSLNGYSEAEELAKKTAKKLGLTFIELSGRRKSLKHKNHKVIYTAGPKEFLSYIKNADFVVTDSFHGTVFSLLYHTEFITFPHKTRNGRISGLLNQCGLSERMTSSTENITINKINWEAVDNNLLELRKKSEEFLQKSIGYYS